ncbi:hypothetical protein [Bradyrhizobium japonicum]|uniref:hypothetical protein n=1 Tax=Bradyrhizobium japonicum TaxID=375 RepID=UPI0012BBBFEA|nr:hypothetical protein [Bradyrhizobium japonicum]
MNKLRGHKQISRFELHKTTAKQVVSYTVEDLLHEYDKIDGVFGDMIEFVKVVATSP